MTSAPDAGSRATARAMAERFALDGPVRGVEPLGRGLINATFRVDTAARRYVLQAINPAVFPDPPRLVRNLRRLAAHLDAHPQVGTRLPRLVPTHEGADWVSEASGRLWRLTDFIEGTTSLTHLATPAHACAVGRALGRFHRAFADLDPARLELALPGFHDTPAVLARLQALSADSDPGADPSGALTACLDFVGQRQALAGVLSEAERAGAIRRRVVHGDPKLDNLLFDAEGAEVAALIDLDTVQAGLVLHDLGDCLRSCCNRQGEAGEGARFALDLAAAILRGYAEVAGALLNRAERTLLPEALRLLPFELGMRFLADHLEGDRYFRVRERGENLRKARVQFDLVADIERQDAAIHRLVAELF